MTHYFRFTVLFLVLTAVANADNTIILDFNQKGAAVADSMYGVFFEEINHAGNGGLYAELVQNRGFDEKELLPGYTVRDGKLIVRPEFEHLSGKVRNSRRAYHWNPQEIPGWTLKDPNNAVPVVAKTEFPSVTVALQDAQNAAMVVLKEKPLFEETPAYLQVKISAAPVHLINSGYWGMGIKKGERYKLRFYLRADKDYTGNITVKLQAQNDQVLATQSFDLKTGNQWDEYTATLTASETDAKAKLVIEFNQHGTVSLDYVSLFPEKTFKNRLNGLRDDVAKMLQDLRPAFIRYPGGCVVEGITVDNRHEWKKSLGDPARRTGQYSTWGYRDTYGFGYHEWLQFCEDIGAKGMFVCNVGLGCQARIGDACAEEDIPLFVDDVLDAIEYAIGDKTTEWGAKRAAAGHPEPFPLQYVEIGNENGGKEYNKRFDIFYKAIKDKYPQLTLISNHGLRIQKGEIAKTDMIDPHWYVEPNFFFNNTTLFDKQPRGDYKVYVGEYAVNRNVGGGNMLAALAEAAFISGMERNGDFVTMCSYAPLFENRNDRTWPVNLIWIDTDSVLGRASYYVQKMYAENRPTYNLKTELELDSSEKFSPEKFGKGMVGLGTYKTQAEFKDIRITAADGKVTEAKPDDWIVTSGEWTNENGLITQKSDENLTQNFLKTFKGEKYTLELKAKKSSGKEGFLLYFGIPDSKENGYMINIAGWGNTRTAMEKISNRAATFTDNGVAHSVKNDVWYNLKLAVNPTEAELFIDGVSVYKVRPLLSQRRFSIAGYDEATNEVIVKVINAQKQPFTAKVNLNGVKEVSPNGRVITLSAENLEDENSFEEPQKIVPKESVYQKFGKNFDYTFPANSFTVLRVKGK